MPAPAEYRTMDVRIPTPEERAAQLAAVCREASREQFRDTIATLGVCAVCSALGVLGMSWAVAMTDAVLAPVVFWLSLSVANGGIFVTLIGAYLRSVERTGG